MIEVVCALIRDSENRYLLVQRSEKMSHPLTWEFPGGKIHPDETPGEAVVREIREELEVEVVPLQRLPRVEWEYPNKKIGLLPIICEIRSGSLSLREHRQHLWVRLSEMPEINILAADRLIIHNLEKAT